MFTTNTIYFGVVYLSVLLDCSFQIQVFSKNSKNDDTLDPFYHYQQIRPDAIPVTESDTPEDFSTIKYADKEIADQQFYKQQAVFEGMHYPYVYQPAFTLPLPKKSALSIDSNQLVSALLLSTALDLPSKNLGFNHPQHMPPNPYMSLLLSHYGRHVPGYRNGRRLYGYSASNNFHNNQPFGAYKIYEDRDN